MVVVAPRTQPRLTAWFLRHFWYTAWETTGHMGALEKDTGDKGQDERESGGLMSELSRALQAAERDTGEKDERERAYGSGSAA